MAAPRLQNGMRALADFLSQTRLLMTSAPCLQGDNALKWAPMFITKDQVVTLHYTLKDETGAVLDQSQPDQPLHYLHGHQNIVPGLEEALEGASAGEAKTVIVPPEKGYGTREEQLVMTVSRDQLPQELVPTVGMTLGMETDEGHEVPVRIAEVGEKAVKLDANHELAGVTLTFEIEVQSMRAATAEELTHGHVHGAGGHHP